MVNLVPVMSNETISSSRMNLIGNYIEDGTHRINTLSLNVGGVEIITAAGTMDFNRLFNVPLFFNKTTDTTDDITDTATNRFTNDVDITRLANTSGTNTGDVSILDSSEIDFTLTGQQITASIKSGSIDETKLDTSVNSSLDLADSAIQTELDPVFTAHPAYGLTSQDLIDIGNLSGTNTGDQDLSPFELLSNKSTNTSLGTSDTLYPSQNAVKVYADNVLGSANALVYKGVIDCSTNPNYPAADAGHLYVVSVAGKIGGASGIDVEVGDMCICNTDSTPSGDQATVGTKWNVIQKNIVGAVTGPASSVDSHVVFFDGVTGKVIKDSGLTLSGTNTGDQDLSGFLHLDQTTPQTIANGYPLFSTGIEIGDTSNKIYRDQYGNFFFETSGNGGVVAYNPTTSQVFLQTISSTAHWALVTDPFSEGADTFGIVHFSGSTTFPFSITTSDEILINSFIDDGYNSRLQVTTSGSTPAANFISDDNPWLRFTSGASSDKQVYFTGVPKYVYISDTSSTFQVQSRIGYDSYFKSWDSALHLQALGASKKYPIYINEAGGNVLIGTATDETTYKLQVNGKTLVYDKIAFTQTDGNEYIDSLNDGYMDYGATTGHRFDSPITQTINSTATTGQLFLRNDGTGDSAIKWGITGDSYIAGIDNSDSDAWKLSYGFNSIDGATFGTNDQIKIEGSTSTHYYYGGVFYFGNPTGLYDLSFYLNGQSKKLKMTWLEDEAEFIMTGGSSNNGKWVMPDIYNGFNKLVFGTGKDSSIGYDGDNMIINPKEVGSGYLNIQGQILVDDKIMFTQTDGNEYIDSLNDGYMDYGATTAHRFSGPVHAVHKAADGTAAVADGTYTVGIGGTTNGTITIKDGIITAVQEAVA